MREAKISYVSKEGRAHITFQGDRTALGVAMFELLNHFSELTTIPFEDVLVMMRELGEVKKSPLLDHFKEFLKNNKPEGCTGDCDNCSVFENEQPQENRKKSPDPAVEEFLKKIFGGKA